MTNIPVPRSGPSALGPLTKNGLDLTAGQTERILTRLERSVVRLADLDSIYLEWRRVVILYAVAGKKAHEARLVAAMNIHGITHVLTFNTDDFARYAAITVMHPQNCATSQQS